MKGYFAFSLIALVCFQVNGYPYGNLSPQFIWDTYRCSNIDPIVDSKTIILVAKGAFPVDQFCHAVRRDLKVSDDTAYTMSVDLFNVFGQFLPNSRTMFGHIGFAFNYWDDQNYDVLYKSIHEDSFSYGPIKNGVYNPDDFTTVKGNPPVQSGKWYNFKIEVSPNKDVKVFLNDVTLGLFKAQFTTRGLGGALVLNGFSNLAEFRNFDVSPILATLNPSLS